MCARRNLVTHEDANLVELLPMAVERKQRPDFKVAGGNIKCAGDFRPVLKVFQPLPSLIAVINNEKFATFGRCAHICPTAFRCSPTCKIAPARSLYRSTETASPCLPGFQVPSSSL